MTMNRREARARHPAPGFPGVGLGATLAVLVLGAATGLASDDGPTAGPEAAGTMLAQASSPPPAEASRGDDEKTDADWPGSFGLFGSETRLAIGGFAQLDVIHDTDAIDSRCDFVTSTIATDGGTPAGGADGQTSYCINASRLTFESRTPTRIGRLKTFVSFDLFGDSSTPDFRVRQAYGELSGAVFGGDLLVGQAWSTFVSLAAWPDTLDYEAPSSTIAVRQPMIRWTRGVGADVDVQIALEKPGDGSVEGGDLLTRWPDAVGVVRWTPGRSTLRASGILRDIRGSADDTTVQTALGWGVAGAGKVGIPGLGVKDNFTFEVSYGEGTGGYYNDSPPEGAYDPVSSTFELLPLFGFYAGFEHGWSPSVSSTLVYGQLEVDNLPFEPDDAFQKSTYFSVNVIWRPDPVLLFGAEYLRGSREDKDGSTGTDNRVQLSAQFTF